MRLGGRPPPPQEQDLGAAVAQQLGLSPGNLRLGAIASLCIAVLAVCLLGFGNVEITEYALNYSLVTRQVEKRTYSSGRYWIGPLNVFIKFPAVLTTIPFVDGSMHSDLARGEQAEDMLRSRTKDGLNVAIELSFQYQLMQEKIYDLYTTLGPFRQFHDVFVRLAIDRLTESATGFSATEFFTERSLIGKEMENLLRTDFGKILHASIFSFQLRTVSLPQEFEEAIQETEVMRQDLQVAMAEQNSTRVSLETQLMQAQKRTEVMTNRGEAEASAVLLENTADIEQYVATQRKSADSYSRILQELGSSEPDLLAYMQARVLRDHRSDKTVVGLDLQPVAKG